MTACTIALANLPFPASPDAAVQAAVDAVAEAGRAGALLVAFPECFVPGYRLLGRPVPEVGAAWLDAATAQVAAAARAAGVAVVLGTERFVDGRRRITAAVIGPDGGLLGHQDKVQLDPSEDATYAPGEGRRVFDVGPLRFGVTICHEGFRYPETVRAAARQGAQLVLHPHVHEEDPGGCRPRTIGDPANSFHEQAIRCRAAENTCFVASINCAKAGSATTSAVAGPDGTWRAWQPYGVAGLLVVAIDLDEATLLLARRARG